MFISILLYVSKIYYDFSMCLLSYDFLLIIPKLFFVTPYTYIYFWIFNHQAIVLLFLILCPPFPSFIGSNFSLHFFYVKNYTLSFFKWSNCQMWLDVCDWLHFQFSDRFFSQNNRILRFQFLEIFYSYFLPHGCSNQSNWFNNVITTASTIGTNFQFSLT